MSSSADTTKPADSGIPKWPENAELKEYKGGCHCKKFEFEFTHPSLDTMPVVTCNCSICNQKGYLFAFMPDTKFKFTKGTMDELSTYEFNKKVIAHRFCPTCGCSIIGTGMGMVAVNARAVNDVDVTKLELKHVNGANA